MIPSDPYYSRPEISNSTLTALYYKLFPQLRFVSDEALQKAYKMGSLVDALITEPTKINYYRRTVDSEVYTAEEFKWGAKMRDALFKHAKKDKFLDYVLKIADTQRVMINPCQHFQAGCFQYDLATKCKWDWWLGDNIGWGGDLKTCAATTFNQFYDQAKAIWARSRVWYMMLAESLNPAWGQRDFIYAISKKNQKVFFLKIEKGDEFYNIGLQQVKELSFKAWCLLA